MIENNSFFPIGVVERDTGIGRDTLRVWERRYGFPSPVRDAKGERSYPEDQLRRLQRTRRLLDRGMRPGKLLPLGEDALDKLEASLLPEVSEQPDKTVEAVLDAIRSADAGQVEVLLRRQYEKRGMREFVLETVIPLLHAVGERWISGRLQIFQEHFLSEQLIRFLNSEIAPHAKKRGKAIGAAGNPARRGAYAGVADAGSHAFIQRRFNYKPWWRSTHGSDRQRSETISGRCSRHHLQWRISVSENSPAFK